MFNKNSVAPELVSSKRVTNLIDVYSFGCMVNEIMSEKQCYHDYCYVNDSQFFVDIRRGLRPTIDKRLPQGMLQSVGYPS